MNGRRELALRGLRPEPLASYLKALGVLRMVTEQADPDARGWWEGDVFVLASALDDEALASFLLDEYRPTPVVAPWNRGSGLRPDSKSPKADRTVATVEESDDPRLEAYRTAIAAARAVCEQATARGWDDKKEKWRWVDLCRATFPDEALGWLDVSAVVVDDDEIAFPPATGSGGVFGRLDISVTYLQRLIDVLGLASGRSAPTREVSAAWLRGALHGEPVEGRDVSIGQFHPGASGGAGSSALEDNRGAVNPWDIVLIVEGLLLFAGSLARRHNAERAASAALPFMVSAATGVGHHTSSPHEQARGELWAPLWTAPTTLAELRYLFGEGRAQWRGRQSRTGLDFAQAAASLGTDRGVDSFVRHLIVQRFGQSDFAVPAGRVMVRERPRVPLVRSLDAWLAAARRTGPEVPASLRRASRQADAALYRLSQKGEPAALLDALVAAADVEEAIAGNKAWRERVRPLGGLHASAWVPLLDDSAREFRLAAAIASQRDEQGIGLRGLLTPVAYHEERRVVEWRPGPAPVPGLGSSRELTAVLTDALCRRLVEQGQRARRDPSAAEGKEEQQPSVRATWGVEFPYRHRVEAPVEDVVELVTGGIDLRELTRLLRGLLRLDWRPQPPVSWVAGDGLDGQLLRCPPFALLAPFFHGNPLALKRVAEPVRLLPHAEWPVQLRAGHVDRVCDSALRRLRAEHLDPMPLRGAMLAAPPASPAHLAAAMLCPITSHGAARLLDSVRTARLADHRPDSFDPDSVAEADDAEGAA